MLIFFFAEFSLLSHATSCAPCAKAKAACKPFDTDKVQAKAKLEAARRSRARKAKQQTDAEWKSEVLWKLEGLDELSGLRKDVQRIAVALEALAGIEGQDSDEELISWPELEGEKTEVQENRKKGKQREEKIDGMEGDENEMESVEEGNSSFSLVAFSVGTRIL